MAATREDISRWFDDGIAMGASHMAVICDTYDHEDFPRYFNKGDALPKHDAPMFNMERLMEVYALHLPKEAQMAEHRAFNYEQPE